jgi:hypothetical protein
MRQIIEAGYRSLAVKAHPDGPRLLQAEHPRHLVPSPDKRAMLSVEPPTAPAG